MNCVVSWWCSLAAWEGWCYSLGIIPCLCSQFCPSYLSAATCPRSCTRLTLYNGSYVSYVGWIGIWSWMGSWWEKKLVFWWPFCSDFPRTLLFVQQWEMLDGIRLVSLSPAGNSPGVTQIVYSLLNIFCWISNPNNSETFRLIQKQLEKQLQRIIHIYFYCIWILLAIVQM